MPPAGNWLRFACSIPPLFVLSHSLPMVNTMGKLALFCAFLSPSSLPLQFHWLTGHCSRATDHHSPHATSSRFTGHCSPAVRQPSGVRSCADPSPLATACHRQLNWQRPNGARSRRAILPYISVCHRTGRSFGQIELFLLTRRRSTVDHSLEAGGTQRHWHQACLPDGQRLQCPRSLSRTA